MDGSGTAQGRLRDGSGTALTARSVSLGVLQPAQEMQGKCVKEFFLRIFRALFPLSMVIRRFKLRLQTADFRRQYYDFIGQAALGEELGGTDKCRGTDRGGVGLLLG
jgi:hypothetical protein